MQALAINRKVQMEQLLGNESREKWSVAIADLKGHLYHADKEFMEILKRDFATNSVNYLPNELVGALKKSIFEIAGINSVLQCVAENDLIFLKIREKVLADKLSPKEFVIAKLLASGLSLKEIARKLNRSPDTVRSHGKAIYEKLGTNKVTQLSQMLLEREL